MLEQRRTLVIANEMTDLEGLEDVEKVVIDAIIEGALSNDSNIHPDLNSHNHPIPRPISEGAVADSSGESWVERLKRKIAEIKKRDPDIYPLY